jgi:pyruvate formate lyase activating enzyme
LDAVRAIAEPSLRIGGLTALSTTDYPGHLAAVVFCQGCPWRCGYCHNPHLLPAHGAARIAWSDVVAFLARRVGLLDAVVFSGGEPLAQRSLAAAMRAVRRMGFGVALHTGGAYPERLAAVLPLADWVGFDVKTSFTDYACITATAGSGEKAFASVGILLESGVPYEFRTTVHPRRHTPDSLAALARDLASLGVRHYALQECRTADCASVEWRTEAAPSSFLADSWCATIAPAFASFAVRRA